jgi:hypothetical protein
MSAWRTAFQQTLQASIGELRAASADDVGAR